MVTKAIIPVAGWGSRRLPITKTIEKCMLPIGNRPIIDYIVKDCIQAGINELIFVVSEQSNQLQDYYRSNIPLNDYLIRQKKDNLLPLVAPMKDIKLHFVVQPSYGKYGTAIPVAIASSFIQKGESVIVPGGDDFFHNPDGSSEVAHLIKSTPNGESGILAAVLPKSDTLTGRYGYVEEDKNGYLVRVTEFPEIPPEPFVKNVSKYLLNYEMLQAIKRHADQDMPDLGTEYSILGPFSKMITSGSKMKVVHAKGQYLDGGTLKGWLHANNVVCSEV